MAFKRFKISYVSKACIPEIKLKSIFRELELGIIGNIENTETDSYTIHKHKEFTAIIHMDEWFGYSDEYMKMLISMYEKNMYIFKLSDDTLVVMSRAPNTPDAEPVKNYTKTRPIPIPIVINSPHSEPVNNYTKTRPIPIPIVINSPMHVPKIVIKKVLPYYIHTSTKLNGPSSTFISLMAMRTRRR